MCLATSGPGATNLVTPIANAYMDSVPMVAITGQVSRHLIGLDSFQEADITGITLPIVKHSYLVKDAKSLPRIIREAFYIAGTGRPGPVLIDIPVDVTKEEMEYDPAAVPEMRLPGYKPNVKGHPKQMREAARVIAAAERPVIYAGGGVIIAERLRRAAGDGPLRPHPGDHHAHRQGLLPRRPSPVHGHAGHARHPVRQLRGQQGRPAHRRGRALRRPGDRQSADLRARGHASSTSTSTRPRSPRTWPWTCPSWATPRRCWRRCWPSSRSSSSRPSGTCPGWSRWRPGRRSIPWWCATRKTARSCPSAAVRKIWEVTKGEAIVCTEVGQNQMWAAQHYLSRYPRRFISSGGLGTMGFGFPAAIGAQVACPDALVVDIAGDGSFQMTIQELATAVQCNLPVKVCILNNQYLGMVRQWQELFWNKHYSHTCIECQPDFVKLAEAYGAEGYRATKPEELEEVLRDGLRQRPPGRHRHPGQARGQRVPDDPGGRIGARHDGARAMKHTLSVLVENKPGVLTRVAGLFARRGLQHRQPGGRRDRGPAACRA